MRHRLSADADRDLQAIYEYTFRNFGERQADRYLSELDRVFGHLGEQPHMGRPFAGSARQFVHGRHIILYRIEGEFVLIGRILHGAQRRD